MFVDLPDYFRKYLDKDELLNIAYIRTSIDDEPLIDELSKVVNAIGSRSRIVLLNFKTVDG